MTKTPVTTATRSRMGEDHGGEDSGLSGALGDAGWSADGKQHEEAGNAREHVPQLVITSPCRTTTPCRITSPCRIELQAVSSGFSSGSHAEEESLCSDSGFGGSPASPPPLRLRKLSSASSALLSPASSFEEYEEEDGASSGDGHNISPCLDEQPPRSSAWRRARSTGNNSPPLAPPPKQTQPWVQVVGHAGSFHAGDHGRLLKRFCLGEQQCLRRLMEDRLRPFVPAYHGVVQLANQEDYNVMDDLLTHFTSPAAIMDCKMGSRTYLEEELVKARLRPQPREDMFEKMVLVDPQAPSAQERAQRGVLKTRYMQWRETLSSTTTMGFRIEGVKKADGVCNTSFKRTKSRAQVTEALEDFVDHDVQIVRGYLSRLKELRLVLETSSFFRTHEVVGSSLLFVHDASGKVGVWMIDFGKTVPLPPPLTLDHRTPWAEGNREDGYLWGLDNLISILTNMMTSTSTSSS